MLISISCWGDWHTQAFIDHGLPSLVPQMTADDVMVLHTDVASHERMMPYLPDACDVDYWPGKHLANGPLNGKFAQNNMFLKDFTAARRRGDVLAMLWPDVIYGKDSLAHYRKLLAGGKRVIYQHFQRVTWETVKDALRAGLSHRDLARLAVEHEHRIMKAHHRDAPRFAEHVDSISWATPEGMLTRLLGGAPIIVDPALFDLDGKTHLVGDPGDRMAFVTDSDDAIGLSLAPGAHEPRWEGEGPFSVDLAREWQDKWGGAVSRDFASQSYRIHWDDVIPADWHEAETEAQAIVSRIFAAPLEMAAD